MKPELHKTQLAYTYSKYITWILIILNIGIVKLYFIFLFKQEFMSKIVYYCLKCVF